MATSKRFLKIEFSPPLLKVLRGRSKADRRMLGLAIEELRETWGQPHLHSGIGIRKLDASLFECRSGLRMRFVFEPLPTGTLFLHFLGSHDAVQQFLKSHR